MDKVRKSNISVCYTPSSEPYSFYMAIRVCYLDCHETGLCCYLVIHIGNLLRPVELFYFHL
jgi:hypothetical protein